MSVNPTTKIFIDAAKDYISRECEEFISDECLEEVASVILKTYRMNRKKTEALSVEKFIAYVMHNIDVEAVVRDVKQEHSIKSTEQVIEDFSITLNSIKKHIINRNLITALTLIDEKLSHLG